MMDLEKLYRDYYSSIFRFTYNYTRNRQEQEDLVQDIFYNIILSLKNFKNKSSLKTYIYAIARNVSCSFIKKNIKDRKVLETVTAHSVENFEEGVDKVYEMSEDVRYFFSIINNLSEDHREVYYLYEIEGLKYEDIAKILDIPVGTVKSRLNRSKSLIYEQLMKEENHGE